MEKDYTLDKGLEALINNFSITKAIAKKSLERPSDPDFRREVREFFVPETDWYTKKDRFTYLRDIDFQDTLKEVEEEALGNLQVALTEDVYKTNIVGLLEGLKEAKSTYYLTLLHNGVSSKEASDDLKNAQKLVNSAKNIQELLSKSDQTSIEQAEAIANQHLNDQKGPTKIRDKISLLYNYSTPKEILSKIADNYMQKATSIIEEKELYPEIERGIAEHKYGRALSIQAAYNSRAMQNEINKQKEAQAASKSKK